MTAAALAFLAKWGSVLGVTFDIVGAFLVFIGVRINFGQAALLEQIKPIRGIDDIGAMEKLMWDDGQAEARARERVRASRWAAVGLIFFVIGFVLQGIASWPKQP